MENIRQAALARAAVLKGRIEDYLRVRESIPTGITMHEALMRRKEKILHVLGGTQADWDDPNWQFKNRIQDVKTLEKLIGLNPKERAGVEDIEKQFRWSISPYYLSLINPDDVTDPIKLMAMPSFLEIEDSEEDLDPMGERETNPAGSITRRYPDRIIINVTNVCAMYCRFCQRRRDIGETDRPQRLDKIEASIEYVRNNPEIRDVLLTGGDPVTLPIKRLEKIISALRDIKHVEYIRIGTRTPITMPQIVTEDLVDMLKKYHPIYVNTHFNHPMEVTEASKAACERLADAGIPLGNQAVLLNGVNNDKFVMRRLNHELLKIRVKPYYMFHAKSVKGTRHFNTSIDEGLEIMEYLRGYTSGMAIPAYIVNAPKGKGKTPLLPEYLVSRGKDSYTIRTWEGEVLTLEDTPALDIKKRLEDH